MAKLKPLLADKRLAPYWLMLERLLRSSDTVGSLYVGPDYQCQFQIEFLY